MYVVTREINEYNQEGEYFVAAYRSKSSFGDLKVLLGGESDVTVGKLTRGGGRQALEDEWFNLDEVKDGEQL